MAIVASDLKMYLSGGSGNTDVNASIGGAISTTQVTDNSLNNLWDNVSGDESAAGDTEYRLVYLKNTHGSLTLQTSKVWILSDTTSADDTIDIGLAAAGLNATETAIANESTAPASVTFSHPTTKGTGLNTGNVPAGQYYGVWIKRIVTASAAASDNDTYQLKWEGDTAA